MNLGKISTKISIYIEVIFFPLQIPIGPTLDVTSLNDTYSYTDCFAVTASKQKLQLNNLPTEAATK